MIITAVSVEAGITIILDTQWAIKKVTEIRIKEIRIKKIRIKKRGSQIMYIHVLPPRLQDYGGEEELLRGEAGH